MQSNNSSAIFDANISSATTTKSNFDLNEEAIKDERELNGIIDPYWNQFPQVPWQAHYFMGSLLVIIGTVGSIGNLLVIFTFTRFGRRQSPANALIVNLAVSDFMTSLLHPMACYSSFKQQWAFGNFGCQLYAAGMGLFGLMSITTLTAISIERFAVICVKPFRRWTLTYKRSLKTIAITWIYCLALILPPFFGWGRFTLEGFLTSCSFDYLDRTTSNRLYIVYLFSLGFFLPVTCIIVCYSVMLSVICKHERDMITTHSVRRQSATHEPNKRVDTKTAKIVLVLIVMFVVSWCPYALVTLVAQFDHRSLVTPFASSLPALFAKASTIYNPIVYGISHPLFRKSMKRWLKCEDKVVSSRGTSLRRTVDMKSMTNHCSYVSKDSFSKSSDSSTKNNRPNAEEQSNCFL